MDEVLRGLPAGARVLDLGSAAGSFPAERYPALVIARADLERPWHHNPGFVQCDAALLPFPDACFDAVISNHSLEHFTNLERSLAEICRVLRHGGALYIAVPSAATLCDKLYRWLARGGGHVNAFEHPDDVIAAVSRACGLPVAAVRPLHTSFSFLNRRNFSVRLPRRIWLVGGGYEKALMLASYLFRRIDRRFGAGLSMYGWAFYFGTIGEPVDSRAWSNVCVRCGSAHPSWWLFEHAQIGTCWRLVAYLCPQCGARNLLTPDE